MRIDHKPLIGMRVQIPVHYDLWMRGAKYGTVVGFRNGKPGLSDYLLVRMDKLQKRARCLKLWRLDWEYTEFFKATPTPPWYYCARCGQHITDGKECGCGARK